MLLADGLDFRQRQGHACKRALVGDRGVEGRGRRKLQPRAWRRGLDASAPLGDCSLGCLERRAGQRRQQPGKLQHLAQLVAQRGAQQLGHAQLVAVGGLGAGRTHPPGLHRHVEDAVGHGHRSLAVHRRVVHLGVKTDPPVGHALDHIELPQRPAAVEQAGVQTGAQRLHLRHGAGLRQHGAAHVVVEVDVVVVDPDRVGQVKRHQCQLAGEHRRQVHAAGDMGLDRIEPVVHRSGRRLEQRQAADMHRHLGTFEVQKGAVNDAQVVHVFHGVLLGWMADSGAD